MTVLDYEQRQGCTTLVGTSIDLDPSYEQDGVKGTQVILKGQPSVLRRS